MEIIFLGIIILIGLVIYNRSKANKLKSEGKIIERSGDYLEQDHHFSTTTPTIEQIFQQLNHEILAEQHILVQTDFSQGFVIFRNKGFAGTFVAVLEAKGHKNDGLYQYSFYFKSISETKDGFYSRTDVFGSNVVLTTIEKAMLKLDQKAEVKRPYAQRKVRTKIF